MHTAQDEDLQPSALLGPVALDGDEPGHDQGDPYMLWLRYQDGDPGEAGRPRAGDGCATTCRGMRAARAARACAGEPLAALTIDLLPLPAARRGWARVRMLMSAVNHADVAALRGSGCPRTFPVVLGCEGVGRLANGTEVLVYPLIRRVAGAARDDDHGRGQGRENVEEGGGEEKEQMGEGGARDGTTVGPRDHVFGQRAQGLMSEWVVVPVDNLVAKPPRLPVDAAAVLGCAWLAAYRMLFSLSGLVADGKAVGRGVMLVQGASGGVATALIQLGVAAGVRVWAAGRAEEKREVARKLGAERTLDGAAERICRRARVVVNLHGDRASWEQAMEAVEDEGRILLCSSEGGAHVGVNVEEIIARGITVTGSHVGTMKEFRDLVRFVTDGEIRPLIDSVVPLDHRLGQGLKKLMEGRAKGKIVVRL